MSKLHYRGGASSKPMMMLMVAIFGVIAMVTLIAEHFAEPSEKFTATGATIYGAILLVVLVISLFAFQIKFEVSEYGIQISWGPFNIPKRRIAWVNVVSVEIIQVRPIEWGGWGYRTNRTKTSTAAILRKGPGLKFELSNNRVFVITIDEPEIALDAIEKAMPHNHQACGHNHDDWTTHLKD
jgi:hypothetical protein